MRLQPVVLTDGEERLRSTVRAFVADEVKRPDYRAGLGMAAGHDPAFTKRLAARGWVGMAIPAEYGGAAYTAVERFIVAEELLAAGLPLSAHWIAERQTAHAILRYGSPEQQRRMLPAIAAGECFVSIGMSEPDAGSDLASVRTTARPDGDGWRLNGTKIWTSYAHLNHYVLVLARVDGTTPAQRELIQLFVDPHAIGAQLRPIELLSAEHHFNSLVLDEVFVPADLVLGRPGNGWEQVTNELVSERAGPDRFLSVLALLVMFISHLGEHHDRRVDEELGRLAARYWAVRQLSLSVARLTDEGHTPAVHASMAKDLGAALEQDTVAMMRRRCDEPLRHGSGSAFIELLMEATLIAPSFTIRGGTTEILRSVISRGLDQL